MDKIDEFLTTIFSKFSKNKQKLQAKEQINEQKNESTQTVNNNDDDFFGSSSIAESTEAQKNTELNKQQTSKKTKQSTKKDKNKKFYIIGIVILALIVVKVAIAPTNNAVVENVTATEAGSTQNNIVVQEDKAQNNTEKIDLKKEEEALNNLMGNIATENEVKPNSKEDSDFVLWKKNIITNLGDANSVSFYLDGEYPQIITKNFKQDGVRNPIISGTDAKINSIIFEQSNDGFLDIVIEIVSNDKSKKFELKYPLLKYINLHFFDDSVVKVLGKSNLILVENEYVFPYLKIEKISSDNEGAYIIFYVKQDSFKGKNFVFRYNLQN